MIRTRRPWIAAISTLLLLGAAPASAQDCPDPGTVIFPGLEGQPLLDSLRVHYRPTTTLTYAAARDEMYTAIDNHGGLLTCIYTGFQGAVSPQSTSPRQEALDHGINAEHTWPQSKGAGSLPMEGDMHHLFPSRIEANAARANHPFAEIPDDLTDRWYRLNAEDTMQPPPALIDEYSELENTTVNPGYTGRWEVREDHKGNTARAMFYFYTVYRGEANAADPNFFNVQKTDLRRWNAEDPPDDEERERTCAIAPFQGGRVNPFVVDPSLVDRAYFDGVPVVMSSFTATAAKEGVLLEWRTTLEEDHVGFHVYRRGAGEDWLRRSDNPVTGGPDYAFTDRDVEAGRSWDYEIESVSRAGATERFGPVAVRVPAPGRLAAAASPNPTAGPAVIRFALPEPAIVRLSVFDASGRSTGRAVERPFSAGRHEIAWDGGAAPGTYFYRLEAGSRSATGKFVVTR